MDRPGLPQVYLSRKRSASPAMLPHSPNKRSYILSPLAEGKGRGSPLETKSSQLSPKLNQFLEKQKNLAQMRQNLEREQAIVDDLTRRIQSSGSESSHTSRHGTPLRDVLNRNMLQQQAIQHQEAQFSLGFPAGSNQAPLNFFQTDRFTSTSPHSAQYNMYPSSIGAGNGGPPFIAQNLPSRYSIPPNALHGQMDASAHQFMNVRQNRLSQPPAFPVRQGGPQFGISPKSVPSHSHMSARSYYFGSCNTDNIEEGLPEISQRQVVSRSPPPLATLSSGPPHNISYTSPMDSIEMNEVESTQSPSRKGRTRSAVAPPARRGSLGPRTPRRASSTTRELRGRITSAGQKGRSKSVAPNAGEKRRKSKSKTPMEGWVPKKGHVPRIQMFSELGDTNFYSMAAERTGSVRLATGMKGVIQTKTEYHTPKPAQQGPTPGTPAGCIFIDSDTPSSCGSLTMEELLRLRGKPKGRSKSKLRAVQRPSTPQVTNTTEVIDLLTPDASASHHIPIVNRPMKERLAEHPRSDTKKKSRARSQSRPRVAIESQKTYQKTNKQKHQENAAREAAERQMNAEVDELFGDNVDMTDVDPERIRQAEARKLALANDRARREAQQQAAKEKRERKAQEDLEQAERAKCLKEEHEAKMKLRREEERKKTAVREAAITEARREQACVSIEAKRLERQVLQADMEREKRKATEVQIEPELIAKVKDRQQEIKLQATSHKIPKASSLVGEKVLSISSSSAPGSGSADADIEESLFVARNTPPSESIATLPQRSGIERLTLNNVYDVDIRTRKAIGPTTAAEVCALAQAPKTTGYRAEREAFEAKILAQKTQERLHSRYKRAKSRERETALEANPDLPTRLQPTKECSQADANIENSGSKDHLITTALFPSQLHSGEATTGVRSAKNTFLLPAKSFSTRPTGSSIVHISDAERQKIETDRRRKEHEEQKARQEKKADENEKRKAKLREERLTKEAGARTDKARERKRLKIIAKAAEGGIQLSTIDIEEQLREFLEKRERTLKRRKHTESLKQQNEEFAPDTLTIQGSFDSQHTQASSSSRQRVDFEDKNYDDEETKVRKANARAARAALDATRQGRGNNFSRAAQMSVEAEYDSDMSEEDADPIFTPAVSEVGEDTEESEVGAASASAELADGTPAENVYGRRRTAPLSPPGENTVKIYYVMEKITINDIKEDSIMKNGYFNREESIRNAKILAEKYKAIPHKAYKEQTTLDDLWEAMVDFGKDSVEVFVLEGYKSTNDGPRKLEIPFDAARFDRKYYMVRQITTKVFSEETGATSTTYQDTIDLVADMNYANQVAADLMIDFLKPSQPHLDYTIQHSEEVAPPIRQALKGCQDQGELFGIDLDMEDGGIPWMKQYTHIEFKVVEKIMKGPLN